jgi:hypothetical protein
MTTITITHNNGQVTRIYFRTQKEAMQSFIDRVVAADMNHEPIVENGSIVSWEAGGRGYDFRIELA